MSNFNIDDPLAGILSDGSDDSFFDDDILGKKKSVKKKDTPTAEKKNTLFDLGETEKPKASISNTKFDLTGNVDSKIEKTKSPSPNPSPSPFRRTYSKESIKIQDSDSKSKPLSEKTNLGKSPAKAKISSSVDKFDILSDLGSESKTSKPLERGKSSQSLLDDILGGSSTKTGSSQITRPTTAITKNQEFDFDAILGKGDSKHTVSSTKTVAQKETVKPDITKNDTTVTKKKSSDDWLGIFQDKELHEDEEDDSDMPAWLGGGQTKKKKPIEQVKTSTAKQTTDKEVAKGEPIIDEDREREKTDQGVNLQNTLEHLTNIVPNINKLPASNEDITTEGATLYLQQQESQLMVALQLKAQDEKLAAMQLRQKESQRVQREAAHAHHAQLDAMLQRQASNRQQMQAIIAAHQERITHRIKDLLGTTDVVTEDNMNPNEEYEGLTVEHRENPQSREKKQLLQLVQSLQENHDKEIDLMETSYRKQLAFLELSLNQTEERMREESDKLVKFYTEKIGWLEEHHQSYKKLTEENVCALTERHKAENEMLRQQHLENVNVLQEHHAALMENIKNAVKQEQVLIQDSVAFSSDLHELVVDVKENKTQFQQLVEKVQALTENTQKDNETSLRTRETQINDMIQQLKKERETFENEKSESREIVRMLETRLKQMTAMIEEESATLKQKRMEFEFEKATFSKQTEFAKNILKRQEDEIKMLREDIEKEYKDKIAKIEDEKLRAQKDATTAAKEKMSIHGLKQELEKMKTELQAQLEEVAEERSKLNVEKQQIHMEEQRTLAKSRDLDLLAKTAIEKQSQADKKYSEAEFIQKKYEERIRRIQEHVVSLNAREKHIAKEKVALSRERLNMHNERKQLESRQQCSLCKTSQNISTNYEQTYMTETLLNVPVSRDYSNANVNSAMNAIELEMTHLMGGRFNINKLDERHEQERKRYESNLESVQMEPTTFKDYMDPRFMMLRLDVQKVISNLDQSKKDDFEPIFEPHDKEDV